jgi:MFS family permease
MTERRALWAIAVAETLIWAGLYYSFAALLVHWEADFDWTKPQLAAGLTIAIATSALASPVFGNLIDKGRGPLVLAGCAALGGAMMLVLSQVQFLWQFYAVWFGVGLAISGCLYEPCFAFITRIRGADATQAITFVTLFAGFAGAVSFPVAHFVSEWAGWRSAALVYGAMVLVIAAPLMFFATRHLERQSHAVASAGALSDAPAGPHFLKKPAFWFLAAGFAFLALNHGIILNHLLPLLTERGVALGTAVLAASMIGPMQVVGRVLMMMAARRVSMTVIMGACYIAIALAAMALLGASGAPWLLAVFVICQGGGYGVMSIVKPVIMRETLGHTNFGAIAGAQAVPYLLTLAGAPLIGALLWLAAGYDAVLVVTLVSAVLGGIVALCATRR